jgi:hypothetical protein
MSSSSKTSPLSECLRVYVCVYVHGREDHVSCGVFVCMYARTYTCAACAHMYRPIYSQTKVLRSYVSLIHYVCIYENMYTYTQMHK